MATPADLSAGGRNYKRQEPHTSAASLAGDVRVRRRGRRDIVGAGRAALAALAALSRDTRPVPGDRRIHRGQDPYRTARRRAVRRHRLPAVCGLARRPDRGLPVVPRRRLADLPHGPGRRRTRARRRSGRSLLVPAVLARRPFPVPVSYTHLTLPT